MPAGNMPGAEVDIDVRLVRALIADQHPDLDGRDLVHVASGWDNAIFRLGEDLCARLPRRQLAASLIDNEQRWLPETAPRLPLPVPAPVRAGRPGRGFPWSWSVCPWFDGEVAAVRPPDDPLDAARRLGAFAAAMHSPAPVGAPANPYRAVPLATRSDSVRTRTEQLSDVVDVDAISGAWERLVGTPDWAGPAMWLHGDLHPANVLVHEGAVRAVIDFGDLTAGDPAVDLAIAWMMFEPGAREVFRDASGEVDGNMWDRARGWALALSLAYVASSADNPVMMRVGLDTLASVLADE